jgi:hypothetical protein
VTAKKSLSIPQEFLILFAERRRVRFYDYLKDLWTAAPVFDGPALEEMTIKTRQQSGWSESREKL